MRLGAPPLRFLVLVVGGWIGVRAVWLVGNGPGEALVEVAAPQPERNSASPRLAYADLPDEFASAQAAADPPTFRSHALLLLPEAQAVVAPRLAYAIVQEFAEASHAPPAPGLAGGSGAIQGEASPASRPPRLTGSAWIFVRESGPATLAPGGTLGGSQMGARLSYRLNRDAGRPLALSGRLYAPLDDLDAAEAAVGIEWQPMRTVPLRILAERRQGITSDGRSAFALLAYGGVSEAKLAGPLIADAYAQAGVVGVRSTDLFADGSLRLSLKSARNVKAGVGLWAAAQPGVERLDAGPTLSVRITPTTAVQADWRFRLAGDATPASGPSVTLATDF